MSRVPTSAAFIIGAVDLVRFGTSERLRRYFAEAAQKPDCDFEKHLGATLDWLTRSQDQTGDGSAKAYHLLSGWQPPYPETSGYLVPTFYEAAEALDRPDLARRAERLAAFTRTTQLPSGAFPSGETATSTEPMVFDTGQIIFGLVRAAVETQSATFLDSASRAAAFLIDCQGADGAWHTYDFAGIAHAYSCRTAWALLVLADNGGDDRHRAAACRNFDWVVQQQRPNGWYASNSFLPGKLPNTHSIAYVTESMVEAFARTNDDRYLRSAKRAVDPLLSKLANTGVILGVHDDQWRSPTHHVCVTGLAQLGRTCLRIFDLTGESDYQQAANRLARQVAACQKLDHRDVGVRGAVPGSTPIFGRYAPMQFPNWAAKFWVDLLLLLQADRDGVSSRSRILRPQAHG
jgi:Squalene-hopene cyclase C-terminal domain